MSRGLTLTEMLFVITILVVLVGVLLVSLLVSRLSYLSAEAYVQVQEQARRAFNAVVQELHQAGHVNNDVAIAEPGVQRLDFQIVRAPGYDLAACGGNCWGTDTPALPSGWIHYVLDPTDPQNPRLMRCVTANRLDPMPAGFAGCRVLAIYVNPSLAATSFTYDQGNRIVTVRIQNSISSLQLPGGSMGTTPVPLITRVRLRNP